MILLLARTPAGLMRMTRIYIKQQETQQAQLFFNADYAN